MRLNGNERPACAPCCRDQASRSGRRAPLTHGHAATRLPYDSTGRRTRRQHTSARLAPPSAQHAAATGTLLVEAAAESPHAWRKSPEGACVCAFPRRQGLGLGRGPYQRLRRPQPMLASGRISSRRRRARLAAGRRPGFRAAGGVGAGARLAADARAGRGCAAALCSRLRCGGCSCSGSAGVVRPRARCRLPRPWRPLRLARVRRARACRRHSFLLARRRQGRAPEHRRQVWQRQAALLAVRLHLPHPPCAQRPGQSSHPAFAGVPRSRPSGIRDAWHSQGRAA